MLDVLEFCPPEAPAYDFPEANSAYWWSVAIEQWIEFAVYAGTRVVRLVSLKW